MKRVMVVGQTGAGKTSLLKALGVWEGHVRKTEALAYGPQCIDMPGEFFDIPMFRDIADTQHAFLSWSEVVRVAASKLVR